MIKQYLPRPHGNHNPQHGGQFFMAADNWHHLEGTFPRAGLFRLYLYDDYTKPLARDRVRAVTGQVVIRGATFRLTSARNGAYLEARLGSNSLPAEMQARLQFASSDARQYVFDFNFSDYTTDRTGTERGASPTRAPSVVTPSPPAGGNEPADPGPVPSAAATAGGTMADDVSELVTQLRARTDLIRNLIDGGRFGEVYVPAFQAKDIALALAPHEAQLAPDKRRASDAAIGTLVRSAYLLDAFGDIGNREQISSAFDQFAAASRAIRASFSLQP